MEDIFSYTSLNKKRIRNICDEVNILKKKYSSLNDKELSLMTYKFRHELMNGWSIDDIICDALAVCSIAIQRQLGINPYDTQIMAAAAMSNNIIAQMQTGEGKTLVQILTAYLHSLMATSYEDKSKWGSVHILTANEYLAKRDFLQNSRVFKSLGLSCSYVAEKRKNPTEDYKEKKRKAYDCDIVYATARTVAFDYLDGNHTKKKDKKFINREMYHAIFDEADEILLDEASTPLLLSGHMPGMDSIDEEKIYKWATEFVEGSNGVRKKPITCKICNQFSKDRHTKYSEDAILFKDEMKLFFSDDLYKEIYGESPVFTDYKYQDEMFKREEAISNVLLAKYMFKNGEEYILTFDGYDTDKKGNKIRRYNVSLVNEYTGRVMDKTKYRTGIQEAIEAREEFNSKGKYKINKSARNVDVGRITYPEFARLYKTGICGMTGTSDIEEFKDLYKLETYEVDPRLKSRRVNEELEVYSTKKYKYEAIAREVYNANKKGIPVLLGTISVNESDEVCKYLDKYNIKYQRLDAKNDEEEAKKIANAGTKGTVTIATNMAGRGTDIKLTDEVKKLGGLYVIGSSKNTNRRIDRQLIGRCGRQGDPGRSKYFSSLEDEIVEKRYGKAKLAFYKKYYSEQKEKIDNKNIINLVEECQIKEESKSKDSRRYSLRIEEKVFSEQRNKIYDQRRRVLEANPKELLDILVGIIKSYGQYVCDNPNELYKIGHLVNISECYDKDDLKFKENVVRALGRKLQYSKGMMKPEVYIEFLRSRMLDIIDVYYISHLMNLDEKKKSIMETANFTGDAMSKFEREAINLFVNMNEFIQNEIITYTLNPNLALGSYDVVEVKEENNNEKVR